jgi:hypothetical protein
LWGVYVVEGAVAVAAAAEEGEAVMEAGGTAALKNAPSQVRVRVPWWWANKVPSQTQTARDLSALETAALALSLSRSLLTMDWFGQSLSENPAQRFGLQRGVESSRAWPPHTRRDRIDSSTLDSNGKYVGWADWAEEATEEEAMAVAAEEAEAAAARAGEAAEATAEVLQQHTTAHPFQSQLHTPWPCEYSTWSFARTGTHHQHPRGSKGPPASSCTARMPPTLLVIHAREYRDESTPRAGTHEEMAAAVAAREAAAPS